MIGVTCKMEGQSWPIVGPMQDTYHAHFYNLLDNIYFLFSSCHYFWLHLLTKLAKLTNLYRLHALPIELGDLWLLGHFYTRCYSRCYWRNREILQQQKLTWFKLRQNTYTDCMRYLLNGFFFVKTLNLKVWTLPLIFLHDFTLFVIDMHQKRSISLVSTLF